MEWCYVIEENTSFVKKQFQESDLKTISNTSLMAVPLQVCTETPYTYMPSQNKPNLLLPPQPPLLCISVDSICRSQLAFRTAF